MPPVIAAHVDNRLACRFIDSLLRSCWAGTGSPLYAQTEERPLGSAAVKNWKSSVAGCSAPVHVAYVDTDQQPSGSCFVKTWRTNDGKVVMTVYPANGGRALILSRPTKRELFAAAREYVIAMLAAS